MPFQCLSEEIAAAPVPMEVTPTQRMLSACAGVLATSLVATPMGESWSGWQAGLCLNRGWRACST